MVNSVIIQLIKKMYYMKVFFLVTHFLIPFNPFEYMRKVRISSESGEKSAQIKHRLQAKAVLNKYVGGF